MVYKYSTPEKFLYNSSSIRDICEDDEGNLLFATYGGGINIFDREHERFSFVTNSYNFV